ncbi:MAG: glycoside hydrolase family 19 protein [Caulobacteraceae bacterium]
MPLVSALQLQHFARSCDYQALGGPFDRECARAEINTNRRIRHFMAQNYVESAGLTRLEECMNYSAERLVQVWPGRFPTVAAAAPFAHNPRALAERVYGGRMGNRAGEGWLFRGRSFNQLTGRDNYGQMESWTGVPLTANPDLALQPAIAARISAEYWLRHGLNAVVDADSGETGFLATTAALHANEDDDVRQAREVINGGAIGLQDTKAALIRAAAIWPG